jgi:hypothetical protein
MDKGSAPDPALNDGSPLLDGLRKGRMHDEPSNRPGNLD